MKIKLLSWKAFALFGLLLTTAPAFAQFRVIGYLPSWTGEVNAVQYDKLTHINYSFLLPNADGSLKPIDNPAKLQSLVSTAHARGVKVLVSVGGWLDGDPSVFVSIANNGTYTNNFNTNLINFANQYGLDGIDIDWEHPTATTANAYSSLMQSLGTQLHSRGKLLSTAVAGGTWAAPYILTSVFNSLDFMNVMAYDNPGADHSSYDLASQSLSYWRGRGLPASKLVLGVPFYAQPGGETYASLLARGADPNADFFGSVGYNGITTIKRKTSLAFDQGSGVMIWQLAGDATGPNSLLTAISQVVNSRSPAPPAAGVVTLYADCNYGGTGVSLPVGEYSLSALQSRGVVNDDLSSLRVSSGYRVVLYADDNFGGASLTLTADNGCLTGNGLGGATWNDQASSLRVQAATTSFSRQLEAESFTNKSGMQVEACAEGGQDMGYVTAGNWLAYAGISFPSAGSYLLEFRVASGANGGTISADLDGGQVSLGSKSFGGTGGWQSWTTVSLTVNVPTAGAHSFGVYASTAGWNLNWIRITKTGGLNAAATASATVAETASSAAAASLELYPNPATDYLRVGADQRLAGSRYQLLDATGRSQASGTLDAAGGVRVAALRAGVYLLVVTTPDRQRLTRRLVKQ